jgi:lipid-binding SYLF domain-containing protein
MGERCSSLAAFRLIPVDIPQELLDKANCVVIYPSVLKAAFIVGGSYGRGHTDRSPWSGPAVSKGCPILEVEGGVELRPVMKLNM